MLNDVYKLTATELSTLYSKLEISPVEVLDAVYQRILKVNPKLNCFSILDHEKALIDAKMSEQRWLKGKPLSPIDGVPTTIKDGFRAIGWPTRMGSLTIDPDQAWEDDAPVTALLRRAGVTLMGKTTMCELGWKGITENAITGVTKNAWNPDKTCGGSSGGAASGLAGGMFPLAVGTDGGGSIRIPASFCGVFGLKPTNGVVPLVPPSHLGSFVHAGPMTRSVMDSAHLMNAIASYDPRDCLSLPIKKQDYTKDIDKGIAGIKVAISHNLGYFSVNEEVVDIFNEVEAYFRDLGADVTIVDPPIDNYLECFNTHWLVSMLHTYLEISSEKRELLESDFRELSRFAKSITVNDYFTAECERRVLTSAMNVFYSEYDLLLLPTMPLVAFNTGMNSPYPAMGRVDSWTPFTCLYNLTRHPAATIPCGITADGLPVGLQITSGHLRDDLVLRASYAYEQLKPIVMPEIEHSND